MACIGGEDRPRPLQMSAPLAGAPAALALGAPAAVVTQAIAIMLELARQDGVAVFAEGHAAIELARHSPPFLQDCALAAYVTVHDPDATAENRSLACTTLTLIRLASLRAETEDGEVRSADAAARSA